MFLVYLLVFLIGANNLRKGMSAAAEAAEDAREEEEEMRRRQENANSTVLIDAPVLAANLEEEGGSSRFEKKNILPRYVLPAISTFPLKLYFVIPRALK